MTIDAFPSASDPVWDRAKATERTLSILRDLGAGPERNKETHLLLKGTREEAEAATFEGKKARLFGALPFFDKREEIVARFGDELDRLTKIVPLKSFPEWKRQLHTEGMLLYELKFGEHLLKLADEILAHYPPIGNERGQKISIFGLSGSGKSTAIEAMWEVIDADKTIVIDNDTVRYNLLAGKLKECDGVAGAATEELQTLIHNRLSGALYMLLEYVTETLRSRGYTTIFSSTSPAEGSDQVFYIEHRDVDPRQAMGQDGSFDKHVLWAMGESLQLVTDQRAQGKKDTYDWEHAETVTDFRAMKDVTVQVPSSVHEAFIQRSASYLTEHPDASVIRNVEVTDLAERKRRLKEQFEKLLG